MDQLPSQLVQFLAPFLRWKVKALPAAFVEGASRETVHEWSQRIHDCMPIRLFVPYSLTVRPSERSLAWTLNSLPNSFNSSPPPCAGG
jgi:hypothetical protein